jgi:hypothetical protein
MADTLKWLVIEEMKKHKWIASKLAGRDLGRSALDEWEHKFWWLFCRIRRFEHIEGEFCWFEFDGVDFAVLQNVKVFTKLLWTIVERMKQEEIIRLKDGREVKHVYENLDILSWAHSHPELSKDVEHIRLFLELININSARLEFPACWKDLALAA